MLTRKELLRAAAGACLCAAQEDPAQAMPGRRADPASGSPLAGCSGKEVKSVDSIRIVPPAYAKTAARKAGEILARRITQRSGARIVRQGAAELTIELHLDSAIGAGGFRIEGGPGGPIRIAGSDASGLISGCGKLLRSSRFDAGGYTPGLWRGTSVPVCPVRGTYLATHFNNWYEAAPISQVEEYLEDLALWGVNAVDVCFPQWQYEGFDDPEAQKSIARLNQILQTAHATGMKVELGTVGAEGFRSSPKDLLSTPVPDPLGRRGHFGVNLCPNNPAAHAVILADFERLMDRFAGTGLDYVGFWPYDEGGCGCSKCWPWGARGFPTISRELSRIARRKFPTIKIILSTWLYDTPPAGEWAGLAEFLAKDKSWVDYILADSHEDFPRYPLEKGVPGGLPLLNFPEISMWGQDPWGGYGANPLPARLQRLWNETERKLAGGFPYSEGIYEDMNKAICSQLYWNPDRPTMETVREYAAYEYSPDAVDPVARAVEIMESNHLRNHIGPDAPEALRLLEEASESLTPQALAGWRWRILYLRALVDAELLGTGGKLEGQTLKRAFEELTTIYRAEHSHSMPIHPPVVPDKR
jgi:hypothetical protein